MNEFINTNMQPISNSKHSLNCLTCEKLLEGKQTKFCSTKCRNTSNNPKFQTYLQQLERGKDRKLELIKSKGGCCEICGYNKNYSALCFHHLDPSQKEMKLDGRKLANSTTESILKEAEKCQLLCHNCHSEVHHPHAVLEP